MKAKAMVTTGILSAVAVAGTVGVLMTTKSKLPRKMAKKTGKVMRDVGEKMQDVGCRVQHVANAIK